MTPVRLEPAAPQSQVKHSTTVLPQKIKEANNIFLNEHFGADFLWKVLWKVSLKILNSGSILKTFTHVFMLKI